MLQAKLVVVGGDTKTQEIELRQLPVLLGRSREATVKLPHPLVSRNHCELFEANGKLFVRDLGSLNGTYVGSERVQSPICLEPEGLLTIGTVTFRAVYEPNGVACPLPGTSAGEHGIATQPAITPSAGVAPLASSNGQPGPVVNGHPNRPSPPLPDLTETQAAPRPGEALDLDQVAFDVLGSHPASPVLSAVAIEDSAIPSAGSVSLSAIHELPPPPQQLSFAGGVQLQDAAPPERVVESRILVETNGSEGTPTSQPGVAGKHRRQR